MSTKVFVGNLAFRTTDQALQESFAKHGKVKAGVIITRGRRSLGYGFVEFFTHEEANAAVEHMNRTDLFGRQIKVELAKDPADRSATPTEGGDRERERGGEPGPAKRRRGARRSENVSKTPDREVREVDGERPAPRRKRNPKKAPTAGTHATTEHREPRAPREPRPPREPRAPREPRQKQPPREKVPSKTTLFVANLPFSVDDEQLRAIFADLKVKAAHVVRTRTNRSRGYGFVEFENEADQQAALTAANGKSVDSGPEKAARVISVSISNSVTSTVPPAAAAPEPSTNQ